MKYSAIASRSLLHDSRRYIILFIAAAFGIALTITCVGLMNGMMSSLNNKARVYYGGDAIIVEHDYFNGDEIIAKCEDFFADTGYIVTPRLDYEDECYFNYEGISVRQRKLKGVDFKREELLFKNFTFIEGDYLTMENSNGVLISAPLAKVLNVHVNDNLILILKTEKGFINTSDVIVKGIFQDSSVFGKNVSYFDIDFLRATASYKMTDVISLGIFKNDEYSVGITKREINSLQKGLSEILDLAPIVTNKQDFMYDTKFLKKDEVATKKDDKNDNELATAKYLSTSKKTISEEKDDVSFDEKNFDKTKYIKNENYHEFGIVPMEVNLRDISFLIKAMHVVIYIIMAILIIIIAIGIGSTYKVIAVKRINEIGMYMALGVTPIGILAIFVIEAFFLMSASFVASLVLTVIIALILRQFDFSMIPNFDIFLNDGHFMITPSILQVALIYFIITVTTILLVCFTVRRYTKISPVEALAVSE